MEQFSGTVQWNCSVELFSGVVQWSIRIPHKLKLRYLGTPCVLKQVTGCIEAFSISQRSQSKRLSIASGPKSEIPLDWVL